MYLRIYIGIILTILFFEQLDACVSFYCINKCGASENSKGYKLILANNRDEDIYRPTWPAALWPKMTTPVNDANVYGALDVLRGIAPNVYSTWLAINDYGNIANLLFYMTRRGGDKPANRGIIVPNYVHQNRKDYDTEDFLNELEKNKFDYKSFCLVLLEMSKTTGDYSIYYMNNNSTDQYEKLNPDETTSFTFGVSNSEPKQPFRKVTEGIPLFEELINAYSKNSNNQELIDGLLDKLLFNTTQFYPDVNLAKFMGKPLNEENRALISSLSPINSNYRTFWPNARTRTRTLILVDYDNNVEYFELNLTVNADKSESWAYNNFTFKLRPFYLNKNVKVYEASSGFKAATDMTVILMVIFSFLFI